MKIHKLQIYKHVFTKISWKYKIIFVKTHLYRTVKFLFRKDKETELTESIWKYKIIFVKIDLYRTVKFPLRKDKETEKRFRKDRLREEVKKTQK